MSENATKEQENGRRKSKAKKNNPSKMETSTWIGYCEACGKPFHSKDAVRIPYREYPGAMPSYEEVSPCCGAGYSDRPPEEK